MTAEEMTADVFALAKIVRRQCDDRQDSNPLEDMETANAIVSKYTNAPPAIPPNTDPIVAGG